MAKKRQKLWSITRIKDPRYPGFTVRITELTPGGILYAIRIVEGKQRYTSLKVTRAGLGSTNKEQESEARAWALNRIAELAKGGAGDGRASSAPVAVSEVLTLGRLVDLYEQRGSLTAQPAYRAEHVAKLRRIAAHIGADKPVVSLSQSHVDQWVQHRREQEERRVRQNTIGGEIAALKIALNWATAEKRADGRPLLDANPLDRVRVEREEPRRPVANQERYRALKAVAPTLPPLFGLALDLTWGTGHRVGAVLTLRQRDILFDAATAAAKATELDSAFGWSADDFPFGGIHWYAERRTNNKAAPHVAPMTAATREVLERAQGERPAIAGAWLFPNPHDASKPLDRYVLRRWLREAEELAGLPHLQGGAWHPFRRGWATAHKHFPDVDVARLGGWRDVATMLKCYTRADAQTIRRIVSNG